LTRHHPAPSDLRGKSDGGGGDAAYSWPGGRPLQAARSAPNQAHAALTEAIAEFRAVGFRASVLFAPDVVQAINSDLWSGIVLAEVLMPEPERNQGLQDAGP